MVHNWTEQADRQEWGNKPKKREQDCAYCEGRWDAWVCVAVSQRASPDGVAWALQNERERLAILDKHAKNLICSQGRKSYLVAKGTKLVCQKQRSLIIRRAELQKRHVIDLIASPLVSPAKDNIAFLPQP